VGVTVGQFGRIDPATGAATAVINSSDAPLLTSNLASGCSGTIFGLGTPNPLSAPLLPFVLSAIDTATGTPTEIGPLGVSSPYKTDAPAITPKLAVDHAGGALYAVHTNLASAALPVDITGVRLLTVNPTTGAATTQSAMSVGGGPFIAAVDAITVDSTSACIGLPLTGVNTAGAAVTGLVLALIGGLLMILVAARRPTEFTAG
jgi:hypothetical protein